MRRKRPNSTFKQAPRTPYVTFQPRTYKGIQRGINTIANVVRPTLGPVPRVVAIEPVEPGNNKRPELLDDAGTIARRILELRDREADMGAMFLRHVLWQQHERAGDGTAITAVIFQSIYNQGVKYIAAGGNAMRLRIALERGLKVILAEHEALAKPLHGREQIAEVARALCHDEALAEMLAEIFDTVSEHGAIDVRSGRGMALERQYVIGSYFRGKPLSEWFLAGAPNRRVELEEAALLVSDLTLNEPADLVPLLRLIDEAGIDNLLLMAREVSEPVVATLLAAGRAPHPRRIIAVKAPDVTTGQSGMLDDIALLVGARPLLQITGDTIRKVKLEDLGRARRVWSDEEFFGIISGKGSPHALRAHVASLRAAFEYAKEPETRNKLRERIGKMLGGAAVLWVGGISGIDIKARKELAERTVAAIRATIGKGFVSGGGVSLLSCRATLRTLAEEACDLDEAMAYRILARALEEPVRTILHNAGYDTSQLMGEIDRAGPGYGFDVHAGQVVDMAAAGIVDSAGVLHTALHSAIASAALALTVDVLVHTRTPDLSFEP